MSRDSCNEVRVLRGEDLAWLTGVQYARWPQRWAQ